MILNFLHVGTKFNTRKEIYDFIQDRYGFEYSDIWTTYGNISFNDTIIIDKEYDSIVGLINYDINDCSEVTINHLEINPAYRNMGYAKQVIDLLKIGANAIYARIDNNSPIGFYIKVGFTTEIKTQSERYLKMELYK